jgi:AcrR family transcriptional regulator
MPSLPTNVRFGRRGRIGILKKVPRDLWEHPRFRGRSKVIERSTGVADEASGIAIAAGLLADLEREFDRCRAELKEQRERKNGAGERPAVNGGLSPARSRAGEQTRREILAVGIREFSEKGLRGARINEIAARTQTTKPMIYYHFGSKQKLYAAVVEAAYAGMRALERDLHLEELAPVAAMRRLVEATFDVRALHPEWVRLIAVENAERAIHIAGRTSITGVNAEALKTVSNVLERGEREAVFRPGLTAWEVHLLITSLCFYRVANRYTWRAIFGMDLWQDDRVVVQKRMVVDAVLRYVMREPA